MTKYKGKTGVWHIEYVSKPIPDRRFDWDFWHDDFDGAPDSYDNRCGNGFSFEDCVSQIEDLEFDHEI